MTGSCRKRIRFRHYSRINWQASPCAFWHGGKPGAVDFRIAQGKRWQREKVNIHIVKIYFKPSFLPDIVQIAFQQPVGIIFEKKINPRDWRDYQDKADGNGQGNKIFFAFYG